MIKVSFGNVGYLAKHGENSVTSIGTITISEREGFAIYSVQSVEDLVNVIIPHFLKYPLITQKKADFLLFKLALGIISRKEHLTTSGLRELVSIRSAMNKGLTEKLEMTFPNTIPVQRPSVGSQGIPDPN